MPRGHSLAYLIIGWCGLQRIEFTQMNEVFKAYALILGNEIVMADSRVDEESQWILADLDVQVSKSKSLLSKS